MRRHGLTLFAGIVIFLVIILVMPSVLTIGIIDGKLTFALTDFSIYSVPTPTPTPVAPVSPPETQETLPTPTPTPPVSPPETQEELPTPEPEPEPEPDPPILLSFSPHATENTDPTILLSSEDIMVGNTIVESYEFEAPFFFGLGEEYSMIEGITAFRGNNFRDTAAYGYADITAAKFGSTWNRATASLLGAEGRMWTGHGWTGQPLIVRWPFETRQIKTNMHQWAKEQEELVEVVYAAMDGYVYFQELETGKDTRDRLFLGWTFKGSGSLDPRGYPLLYVGAGDNNAKGAARILIVSLIDGSVLYEFGFNDRFAPRGWHAADSSPLVDIENDRLIYPSENGTLYILDLNTDYDPAHGTIAIDPVTVKWRYRGKRSNVGNKFWLGIENSMSIYEGYAYFADNGGHMLCLNLNTLETVWVHDSLDDTNNSPVFSIEDQRAYIYISTGFHGGWRAPSNTTAVVPIWKLDAETGEVVWQVDYYCYTVSGVSGGVQGTIALGKNDLDDLIFVPVARTPTGGVGVLAAISKSSGEIVWEFRTPRYSWSSPVCVYTEDGKGYIVYNTANGDMYLLDGLTGEIKDKISVGSLVESSPAIFENTVVIGTRSQRIMGVKIT